MSPTPPDVMLQPRSLATGRSLLRNEDPMFLTGQAAFVGDLRIPLVENAAHAVFVRSIYAHAHIASVDLTEANRAPGVLATLPGAGNPINPTSASIPTLPAEYAQPLLAHDKVRYVGEAVAVVVAETQAEAVDAAELVVVAYRELPPVLTIADAVADQVRLFAGSNIVMTAEADGITNRLSPERFNAAEVLIHQKFVNPRQVAAPIECRGAVAAWSDDGHLHAWVSTQRPHKIKELLSGLYNAPPTAVHVVAGPFVGGGFGGKGTPGTEEQLLPQLARITGRPVRWTETRSENLNAAVQGRGEELEVWLAGRADGTLEAIKVHLHKYAGAYPSTGTGLVNHYSYPMLTGTYHIGHVEYDSTSVVTNRPPVAALRGAGRAPLVAALERVVDLYAQRIGMDPADVRRSNLIDPKQMPYTTPTGGVYDEADYRAELDRALARARYQDLRTAQQERRDRGELMQLGIGIASFNHRTSGGGTEEAIVTVNADGSATVITGTTSQGHGHAITWAQLASDELGIAVERISVVEGVTDQIASGVGAIGSRSLQVAGLAIHEAAAKIVVSAAALAADLFEAAPADIVFDRPRGSFHVAGSPSRELVWADLATEGLRQDQPLSCDHVYDPDGRDVYPSGCHVAVVEVDIETGGWRLKQYVAVDDAGVRVNPMIVEGQLHGGIALGAAQVMGEEVIHDADGNALTTTFMEYQVASIDQFCQFELEAAAVASSFNAHGYKAVGESGPIGATPAVHNAVMDALSHLGVTHVDIPCTPQKIWQAIGDASGP